MILPTAHRLNRIFVVAVAIEALRRAQGLVVIGMADIDSAVHIADSYASTSPAQFAVQLMAHPAVLRDMNSEVVRDRAGNRASFNLSLGVGGER